MPFTADELENIVNSKLDTHDKRGHVEKQETQNKPMLASFQKHAKDFAPGKEYVTVGVGSGKGGGQLSGYSHDDVNSYYNPTGTKRPKYPWKEHHIGMGLTHTELKIDGITVVETGAMPKINAKEDREAQNLAELLDEKVELFDEDYDISLDALLHGNGTADVKALAGIGAFILDDPSAGSTGGLPRTFPWWRNRAATAAANTAGSGAAPIVSSPANGGSLLQFLQEENRQLGRYTGRRRSRKFAGSSFIGALETELRANGQYASSGWRGKSPDGTVDGAIPPVRFDNILIEYDPTLDDMGLEKRMFDIDMRAIQLRYMTGEKKKRHNPARPHDRYVLYRAYTTTAVVVANRLNSSGVYDIS